MRLATNVNDPIGDLLSRIRNANTAAKEELLVPVSKMNEAILRILATEGFIDGYERAGEGIESAFKVQLRYGPKRARVITGLRRISKPGRRVYTQRANLPRVLGGLGIAIVSTSQGVMTDKDAARKGIGGEILAHVW
ncbi:MAG: 30S ribosomal protein S8 [Actinomycetota bacterium]